MKNENAKHTAESGATFVSKTLNLAQWLDDYAEVLWGCADNEKDKWEARRMLECAAELRRYERLKIRFRDQLKPMREAPVMPQSIARAVPSVSAHEELVAALEDMTQLADSAVKLLQHNPRSSIDRKANQNLASRINAARAAIQKATTNSQSHAQSHHQHYSGSQERPRRAEGRNVNIEMKKLPYIPPDKPKELIGPISQAWDYLVNCGGVCRAEQFDDDFLPAGPAIRSKLAHFGVLSSTSGKTTIIFFPESPTPEPKRT